MPEAVHHGLRSDQELPRDAVGCKRGLAGSANEHLTVRNATSKPEQRSRHKRRARSDAARRTDATKRAAPTNGPNPLREYADLIERPERNVLEIVA